MGNVLQNNDSISELNPDEVKKNIVDKFKGHIPDIIFSLLIGVPTFSIMLNHVFETLGGAVESMEIPFIGFIVAYSVLPFLVTWLWILFYDKQKDAISKKIGFVAIALQIVICVVALLFTRPLITDMANKYKNVKAHREIVVKAEKKRDSTEYWYYRGLMGGKTIDSTDMAIKEDLKLGDSIGSKNSSMAIYKEATADAQRTIIASKVVENGFAVSAVEVVAIMRWIIGAAFVLSFSALLYWRKELKKMRKNTIVTNALMSNMAGLFTLVFLILSLFPKIEAKDIKTDKPLWFLFIPSWYALEGIQPYSIVYKNIVKEVYHDYDLEKINGNIVQVKLNLLENERQIDSLKKDIRNVTLIGLSLGQSIPSPRAFDKLISVSDSIRRNLKELEQFKSRVNLIR